MLAIVYITTYHALEALVVPYICQDIIETVVRQNFLETTTVEIADKLMFPFIGAEVGV